MNTNGKKAGLLFLALVLSALAADPEEMLLRDAVRYATTPEKRARKEKAKAELTDRGADGLRLVMRYVHLENIGVQVLVFEMVENLDDRQAASVLVDFQGDERSETRRLAAWLLGFCETPEHAGAVRALLADEETSGAALRTLGKWRCREAVPEIRRFVRHERETRRVAAINALRDIGDPAAIPDLLDALGDPYFTVREAAAKALASLGAPAGKALLRALPGAEDPARRHILRTLGALRSRRAAGALRRQLKDPDPFVRAD
ncbi:MAG: HEAT repeat domain-containing protein, partial [Verrucomicrobia bacterium]|nr:HEAT repeat domain-containing protein [Verrucomicrobiota bacterium]